LFKKLIGVVLICVLVLAGYCFTSPYIVMYQIKRAANIKDIDAFSEYIDFVSIRESVKDQVFSTFGGNTSQGILSGLVSRAIDNLISELLTPEMLASIVRGEKFQLLSDLGIGPKVGSQSKLGYTRKYLGFNLFSIMVKEEGVDDSNFIAIFEMSRNGCFAWLITDILLGPELLTL
jgi:hypothetical protein